MGKLGLFKTKQLSYSLTRNGTNRKNNLYHEWAARATFFGNKESLGNEPYQHQLQRASALNIIINAISIWNTLHLTKAVEYQKQTGSFNEDYMSPLGWEHINLLGEYHFKSEKVISLDSLRPLKLS
ncbi:hypothetical protein C7Y47_14465 [Lysinibacillus sphaericus]|uniref:Tn3 transposase DDE domain-containing protein n=1 Tax=Lysinibacillus sphaericus TaxID=1421 RepID=A0A544UF80_LYSSH|nr:hypothetical protein C7Y47_14465 [Lysinibacillus sp. SDF0037]